MCGICGAVALGGQGPVDPDGIAAMCATLVHRGPDSAGQVSLASAGIAMRRLAIIDLDGGSRGMTYDVICEQTGRFRSSSNFIVAGRFRMPPVTSV